MANALPGGVMMERPGWVLVVDDDADNREVFRTILEDEGYRVSTVADGTAALDHLLSSGPLPDVVLLDLHMPGLSGWDVLDALAASGSPVPIVAASADKKALDCLDYRQVAAVLTKPFHLDDLLSVVAVSRHSAGAPAKQQAPQRVRQAQTARTQWPFLG
jgi:CheY-like chemotaxis protein